MSSSPPLRLMASERSKIILTSDEFWHLLLEGWTLDVGVKNHSLVYHHHVRGCTKTEHPHATGTQPPLNEVRYIIFLAHRVHDYTMSRKRYRFHIRSISFSSYCSLISLTRKTRYRPSLSKATMYNFSSFCNRKHLSILSSKKQSPSSRMVDSLSSTDGLKA